MTIKMRMHDPWLFLINLQTLFIPPSAITTEKTKPKSKEEVEKEKKEFQKAKEESVTFDCFT